MSSWSRATPPSPALDPTRRAQHRGGTRVATRASAYPADRTCSSAVMRPSWCVRRRPWLAALRAAGSSPRFRMPRPHLADHAGLQCHQDCSGTCAHRGAGIRGNEIDAQPSDNGGGVVFVQTVEGEAVVEQSRRFKEHLTSHLEVHLGPCPLLPQPLPNWSNGGFHAGRHTASVSMRPRPSKRISRFELRGALVATPVTRTATSSTARDGCLPATGARVALQDDNAMPRTSDLRIDYDDGRRSSREPRRGGDEGLRDAAGCSPGSRQPWAGRSRRHRRRCSLRRVLRRPLVRGCFSGIRAGCRAVGTLPGHRSPRTPPEPRGQGRRRRRGPATSIRPASTASDQRW